MIRFLLLILVICAGFFVGAMLVDQKGYVLIAFDDWTIESSVVFMVMAILVFYACLQLLEWGIVNLFAFWGRTRHWFGWRKQQVAQQKTLSSLLDLAGGRFALAEKNSARYASLSEQPVLNYLTAANAAQRQGKTEQRDKYLESAALLESDDSALLATRLQLLIDDGDYLQAAQWLEKHKPSDEITALALPIYQHTQQWQRVLDSAKILLKNKSLGEEAYQEIVISAHQHLLSDASLKDSDSLHICYNEFARKVRNNIDIFSHYAKLMIKLEQFPQVESALFKRLRKKESQSLVMLLSELTENDAKRASEQLINLSGDFDEDAIFLQTIAQLLATQRQWQLAKEWYVKAIALKPTAELYHQLAHVQQELGEKNGALSSFNSALRYLE